MKIKFFYCFDSISNHYASKISCTTTENSVYSIFLVIYFIWRCLHKNQNVLMLLGKALVYNVDFLFNRSVATLTWTQHHKMVIILLISTRAKVRAVDKFSLFLGSVVKCLWKIPSQCFKFYFKSIPNETKLYSVLRQPVQQTQGARTLIFNVLVFKFGKQYSYILWENV